jgi:hypothetical protein
MTRKFPYTRNGGRAIEGVKIAKSANCKLGGQLRSGHKTEREVRVVCVCGLWCKQKLPSLRFDTDVKKSVTLEVKLNLTYLLVIILTLCKPMVSQVLTEYKLNTMWRTPPVLTCL